MLKGLLFILLSGGLCAYEVDKLPEIYQDVLVKGEIHRSGRRRACEERYEKIKEVLTTIEGPLTVLDIGASQGYFSLRIARDFPHAKIFMVEGGEPQKSKALLEICQLNDDLSNITYFDKALSSSDINYLVKNEHFTVVLLLNVLYFLPENSWDKLTHLGDFVFLEAPQNCAAAHRFVTSKGEPLLISETKLPNFWAKSHLHYLRHENLSSAPIREDLLIETKIRLNQRFPQL